MSAAGVVIAGGGTGGHIYPALAVLERLAERREIHARYLCSERSIDRSILERAQADGVIDEFTPIAARPFIVRPKGLASLAWNWGRAVRAARSAIDAARRETGRDPVLLSTGGFVSVPACRAALAERIPHLLVNLDSVPGKANRYAARRCAAVLDAAPNAANRAGGLWTPVGPIIRAEALTHGDRPAARAALGLDPELRTLLVTGGSQGARSVGAFVRAVLASDPEAWAGWQAVHQSPEQDLDETRAAYRAAGVRAVVEPFLADMREALSSADLHVGRSGAGLVAETWAAGLPSLFFPYPYHHDQHQRLNAEPLVGLGLALIADDHVDPGRNLSQHGSTLVELLRTPERLESMRAAAAERPAPQGADAVADALAERLK